MCAAIYGRPMMKFESGYTVETVFDGSKLGIEPYSVEVLPEIGRASCRERVCLAV